jgi:hypothetical protein
MRIPWRWKNILDRRPTNDLLYWQCQTDVFPGEFSL